MILWDMISYVKYIQKYIAAIVLEDLIRHAIHEVVASRSNSDDGDGSSDKLALNPAHPLSLSLSFALSSAFNGFDKRS